MLGMSAFKRKARQFTYNPRFYDPQKEERDARQRVNGVINEGSKEKKYIPGSIIRAHRIKRMTYVEEKDSKQKARVIIIRFIIAMALLCLVAYFIITFDGIEKILNLK